MSAGTDSPRGRNASATAMTRPSGSVLFVIQQAGQDRLLGVIKLFVADEFHGLRSPGAIIPVLLIFGGRNKSGKNTGESGQEIGNNTSYNASGTRYPDEIMTLTGAGRRPCPFARRF